MNDWRCPLCQWKEADRLFSGLYTAGTDDGPFHLVRCSRCGLFSMHPRPQRLNLLSLYPEDYEPFWGPVDEETKPLLRWARRRHYGYRCHSVRRARPGGGRVLDIGCGTGLFLSEMARRGSWHGVGMDINQRALDVARRQAVPCWCGEAGDLCLSTASIDIVTMWDVLEHVLDPRKTLAEIHRILKPDGVLLLSTPNGQSWQARLWGKFWCGWDMPRHLQVFAPQTLHRFLTETGFEVVRHLSFPMERFYLVESGRRWLKTYQSAWAEFTASWLTPLLGWTIWPVLRLIDRTPSASSIVLEARVVTR